MKDEQHSPRLISGRYELGRLLGQGGMASVHYGRDPRLERDVAIKLLRPDFVADATALQRFRREARSAARLNHPKIIAVYDSGEDTGVSGDGRPQPVPFIVMEYVAGKTVRELLHYKESLQNHEPAPADIPTKDALSPEEEDSLPEVDPLALEEAVKITVGVLEALEYSHSCGIIHRDIKPGNVLVTEADEIKVMDFGIARALADQATHTSAEAVLGTAQYLSPEQATSDEVDQRTDLYSTGCLLFELLTGRTPFVGERPVSIVYQHVHETPPSPQRFNSAISDELNRVVLKALAKDPDERYANAGEFAQDLLAAVSSSTEVVSHSTNKLPESETSNVQAGSEELSGASGGSAYFTTKPIMPTTDSAYGVAPTGDAVMVGPPPKTNPTGKIVGYVALAVTVFIVFSAALLVASRLANVGPFSLVKEELRVPQLVGLSHQAAHTELTALGLRYAEDQPVYSSFEAGTVVSSTPLEGAPILPGQEIRVVLSKGPEEIVVPQVTRFERSAAEQVIKDARLRVVEVTIVDDASAPKDTVTEVVPPPGTKLAPDSAVTLKVSSGMVSLPNLAGTSLGETQRTLKDLNLEPRISYKETTAVAPEHIVSHKPGPGLVRQWSLVQIVVAQKPRPKITPKPTATAVTPTPTATTIPTATPTKTAVPLPTTTATTTR